MCSLTIHTFNVGQGDCIVLEYKEDEDKKIWGVVDCFESGDDTKTSPLEFLKDKERKIKRLEFVCLTHPDKDHYVGMLEILNYFNTGDRKIDKFWDYDLDKKRLEFLKDKSKDKKASDELSLLYEFVEEKDRKKEMVHDFCVRHSEPPIEGITIRALSPIPKEIEKYYGSSAEKPDKHKLCIVLVIMLKEKNILLGSDASTWIDILDGWLEYCRVKQRKNVKFDFVKVSHHGSKYVDYGELWKEYIKEDKTVAVISTGCKRALPHPDVLRTILSHKVRLYSTNLWDFSKVVSRGSAEDFLKDGCLTSEMLEEWKRQYKSISDKKRDLQKRFQDRLISPTVYNGLRDLLEKWAHRILSPCQPYYHGNCAIRFSDGDDCEVGTQSGKPHISFC